MRKKIEFNLAFVAIVIIIVLLFITIAISKSRNKKTDDNASFEIKEILLYSNADVVDNSEYQSLEDISANQFSDISITIDNKKDTSELTSANTIKELYIDNIKIISRNNYSEKILNYKNPLSIGKYTELQQPENERIDFKIISSNEEDYETNYDEPTFFTDCSNPITLGYLNKNVLYNYSISDNNKKIYYNAKILKEAGINTKDLNSILKFTIHIINNKNQHFYCDITTDLSLDDDFTNVGYSFIRDTSFGEKYKFIRE